MVVLCSCVVVRGRVCSSTTFRVHHEHVGGEIEIFLRAWYSGVIVVESFVIGLLGLPCLRVDAHPTASGN